MHSRPWSRSRYWLCHSLHSRHERWRLDEAASQALPWVPDAARRWLANFAARTGQPPRWIVDRAARDWAADPAFVQCLRLLVKEEHYAAQLADTLLRHEEPSDKDHRLLDRLSRPIRRVLGVRFEVSVLLLQDVLDLMLARCAGPISAPWAPAELLTQVVRDRQAHVAYLSEWLTVQFADFNFPRRNLRRLRLRVMFSLMLMWVALVHGRYLDLVGMSRWGFALSAWEYFGRLLEGMVPYHRDALLARLLEQRNRPYDKPASFL